MSVPPAPPLLLASTSPRRKQILEQLGTPFDILAPRYEETEEDPVAHALGKARSVLEEEGERPVVGCDTEVICGGRVYGKPESAEDAEERKANLLPLNKHVGPGGGHLRGVRDVRLGGQ